MGSCGWGYIWFDVRNHDISTNYDKNWLNHVELLNFCLSFGYVDEDDVKKNTYLWYDGIIRCGGLPIELSLEQWRYKWKTIKEKILIDT